MPRFALDRAYGAAAPCQTGRRWKDWMTWNTEIGSVWSVTLVLASVKMKQVLTKEEPCTLLTHFAKVIASKQSLEREFLSSAECVGSKRVH
ncbi:UNVERIFIED_CONTAM: hypothetical protein FKN15_015918 [Acipenser sinensis]